MTLYLFELLKKVLQVVESLGRKFATSVRTFRTMNYWAMPKDKWLLVSLLNNTTQSGA